MSEKEVGLIEEFVSIMIANIVAREVIFDVFAEMSDEELEQMDKILDLYNMYVDREELKQHRLNKELKK